MTFAWSCDHAGRSAGRSVSICMRCSISARCSQTICNQSVAARPPRYFYRKKKRKKYSNDSGVSFVLVRQTSMEFELNSERNDISVLRNESTVRHRHDQSRRDKHACALWRLCHKSSVFQSKKKCVLLCMHVCVCECESVHVHSNDPPRENAPSSQSGSIVRCQGIFSTQWVRSRADRIHLNSVDPMRHGKHFHRRIEI